MLLVRWSFSSVLISPSCVVLSPCLHSFWGYTVPVLPSWGYAWLWYSIPGLFCAPGRLLGAVCLLCARFGAGARVGSARWVDVLARLVWGGPWELVGRRRASQALVFPPLVAWSAGSGLLAVAGVPGSFCRVARLGVCGVMGRRGRAPALSGFRGSARSR